MSIKLKDFCDKYLVEVLLNKDSKLNKGGKYNEEFNEIIKSIGNMRTQNDLNNVIKELNKYIIKTNIPKKVTLRSESIGKDMEDNFPHSLYLTQEESCLDLYREINDDKLPNDLCIDDNYFNNLLVKGELSCFIHFYQSIFSSNLKDLLSRYFSNYFYTNNCDITIKNYIKIKISFNDFCNIKNLLNECYILCNTLEPKEDYMVTVFIPIPNVSINYKNAMEYTYFCFNENDSEENKLAIINEFYCAINGNGGEFKNIYQFDKWFDNTFKNIGYAKSTIEAKDGNDKYKLYIPFVNDHSQVTFSSYDEENYQVFWEVVNDEDIDTNKQNFTLHCKKGENEKKFTYSLKQRQPDIDQDQDQNQNQEENYQNQEENYQNNEEEEEEEKEEQVNNDQKEQDMVLINDEEKIQQIKEYLNGVLNNIENIGNSKKNEIVKKIDELQGDNDFYNINKLINEFLEKSENTLENFHLGHENLISNLLKDNNALNCNCNGNENIIEEINFYRKLNNNKLPENNLYKYLDELSNCGKLVVIMKIDKNPPTTFDYNSENCPFEKYEHAFIYKDLGIDGYDKMDILLKDLIDNKNYDGHEHYYMLFNKELYDKTKKVYIYIPKEQENK